MHERSGLWGTGAVMSSVTATAMSARTALVLLCATSFIAVADTTIVSIALPSMRQELGFSVAGAQWIFNAYTVALGGLLLLLGRAADLYGRRRLLLIGLAVFAVGSLLGGFAWDETSLVSARVVQGIGAAAFVPSSLSLLTSLFNTEPDRSRAIGLYGAMAGIGFIVGMGGGGLLTEFLGWRWVFFVNVPVVVAVGVAVRRVMNESRAGADVPRTLDPVGALTLTTGLVAVIYGISEVPRLGWLAAPVLGGIGLGIVLLAGFVLVENRHPNPLVPLPVVRRRTVWLPNAARVAISMLGMAHLYVLTLYFQEQLGHDPLTAGLLFTPMTVASALAAVAGGRIVGRFGPRSSLFVSLWMVVAGLALTLGMGTGAGLELVLVGSVIEVTGFMVAVVALTVAGTAGVDERDEGLAAGIVNTAIQLGNALGLGIVAPVIAAAANGDHAVTISGLRWGVVVNIAFVMLAFLLVLPRGWVRRG
jgi:EmrB/QacA subfamily drug resistance transporter